jgi:hypothetical protein
LIFDPYFKGITGTWIRGILALIGDSTTYSTQDPRVKTKTQDSMVKIGTQGQKPRLEGKNQDPRVQTETLSSLPKG